MKYKLLPFLLLSLITIGQDEVPEEIPIEEQRNNKIKVLLDVVKENKSIYVQKDRVRVKTFIELKGQTITVDYFRIGRLGWYYRSANGKETGYWNKFEDRWIHTNGKLNDEIKLALDIANRQTPPNFITLPVQPVEK